MSSFSSATKPQKAIRAICLIPVFVGLGTLITAIVVALFLAPPIGAVYLIMQGEWAGAIFFLAFMGVTWGIAYGSLYVDGF